MNDWLLLFWLLVSFISFFNCELPLPIVYVYTVVGKVCNHGLPKYIRITLEQAVFTQPDADVYLIANIGECSLIQDSLVNIHGVHVIDSKLIESQRTRTFRNLSDSLFASDGVNELWMTSALRFFVLEDVMVQMKWSEMMHAEADNLMYGRYSTVLPILRKHLIALSIVAVRSFFNNCSSCTPIPSIDASKAEIDPSPSQMIMLILTLVFVKSV